MINTSKYLLITNVYNEADKIKSIFDVVSKFRLKPRKWMIINDGSNDNTTEEIEKCIGKFPISNIVFRVIVLPPKEKGDLTRIGEAYRYAFDQENLMIDNYLFMSILDVDTELHPDYYWRAYNILQANPDIGIVSGYAPNIGEAEEQPEGNAKCVRWDIVKDIVKSVGFWDPAPDTQLNIHNFWNGYKWCLVRGDVGLLKGPTATRNRTYKGAFHAGWFWAYVTGSRHGAYARMFYRMLKRRYGLAFIRGYRYDKKKEKRFTTDAYVHSFYKDYKNCKKLMKQMKVYD
jgi:glycosyltransferase involved in cell wall biosynthesis